MPVFYDDIIICVLHIVIFIILLCTKCGEGCLLYIVYKLLRPRERLRSIVVSICLSVCLSVCLSARISPEPQARSSQFLCMLPMSVARSSSGMLTIGRIAYRREGGDGSAQRGRSVLYDCLV